MHQLGKVILCTLLCLLSLGALTDTSHLARANGESSFSAPASSSPAAGTQHRVHHNAPPDGVSAEDWANIRQAYEENRHRALRVAAGYQARNPGQQWLTHFDGRGFMVQPDAGAWRWGLVLRSYGFSGHARPLHAPACVTAEGGRVAYAWDQSLEEWFINEWRGLEHGFTIKARPAGGAATNARLELRLAVRGELRPQVQAESGDVSFVNEQGQAAVNYTGLTVYDADGRQLPAQFTAAGEELRLTVDERGARYPLTIDPWAQQAYLKASNTEANDNFGREVAISGDTIVVGASGEDSNATGVNGNQSDNSAQNAGAAYVFVRSGTTWSQQAYLKASNTEAGDLFGGAVAISGDTIVVGAALEDSNATGVNGNQNDNSAQNAGAAYVFVRSGATWSQQAYLKASNTGAGDQFGVAVAISGDTIVVGADQEASNATGVNGNQSDNSARNAGAAYVFVRSGTTWSQQAYLKASNTEVTDVFGFAVAISGDTIVVGAYLEDSNATGVNGNQSNNSAVDSGAAYVFFNSDAPPPDLSLTKSDSGNSFTIGAQSNYIITVNNAADAGPTTGTITINDTLPANLTLASFSGAGFNCSGVGTNTVTCTHAGPLIGGASLPSLTLTVNVGAGTPTGANSITNTATVSTPGEINTANNAGSDSTTVIGAPPPGGTSTPLGPGQSFAAAAEISDQKPGSVLVYNLYTSSAAALNTQNARINLANTNPRQDIAVHLFFVDGQTCSIADAFVCLTRNQTTSFLASDIDPGTTGYLIAVAADATTGCPANFNFLIGSVDVKFASGHQARLNAEAIAALDGRASLCDGNSLTAQLNFDGVSYNRLPRTLALDSLPARADGNDTLIVLNRIGGNLAIGAATLSSLFGNLYDDAENALSFTFSPGTCQFRSSLSSNFLRTTPRIESFIAAGHTGWAKFYSQDDQAILGAALTYNVNTATSTNAFTNGANLHKLTLTSTQTLVIPIFPPNCPD